MKFGCVSERAGSASLRDDQVTVQFAQAHRTSLELARLRAERAHFARTGALMAPLTPAHPAPQSWAAADFKLTRVPHAELALHCREARAGTAALRSRLRVLKYVAQSDHVLIFFILMFFVSWSFLLFRGFFDRFFI